MNKDYIKENLKKNFKEEDFTTNQEDIEDNYLEYLMATFEDKVVEEKEEVEKEFINKYNLKKVFSSYIDKDNNFYSISLRYTPREDYYKFTYTLDKGSEVIDNKEAIEFDNAYYAVKSLKGDGEIVYKLFK